MTAPPPALAVRTESLRKEYPGGKVAVDDLSLSVARGEFFGFVGPNGAGKSTTIRMLCGLVRPTAGHAEILGRDVARDALSVKASIGLLPEEIHTFERLSAAELLEFTGRMHGLTRTEARRRAGELLDFMELSPADRHTLLVDYSMGMKKKTLLAAALIHAPRVLFLDEPFNGIDTVTSRAIREALSRAVAEGVTVFFSSHVMETVERLCHRVAVIDRGRLLAVGDVAGLAAQAGLPAGTPLEEVYLRLLGDRGERGDLSWMRG